MALNFLESFTGMFKDKRIDVLERFDLLREAISGTMSSFYMARDKKTGKVVGLKILDPEKCAAFEERFLSGDEDAYQSAVRAFREEVRG